MGLGSSSAENMVDSCPSVKQLVKELIASDDVVIFSKSTCPYCKAAKKVSFKMYQIYTFYAETYLFHPGL
jgi:thioredoxin-related protein